MSTVKHRFSPRDALYPASVYAQFKAVSGTNFPVESLAFDAALDETVYFVFSAHDYVPGNLTARFRWYADTASSGVVTWQAALAAITPDSDTTDIETKSFDTAQTVDDTHLGTTGQRLHEVTLTMSNLNSLTAEDWCVLRIRRLGSTSGTDTMAGDALLTEVGIDYSDVI